MNLTYLARILSISAACLLFTAALTASAPAADVKLAKITLATVYKSSLRIKNFTEELQQLQTAFQAKETLISADIRKLREQLQAGKDKMPKDQQDKLDLQIQAKGEELENERMTLQYNLSLKQQSVQNVVVPQIREIVAKIAKAEGFTLVITEQSVMYVAEEVPDITEKVTKALDEMPATEKQSLPQK